MLGASVQFSIRPLSRTCAFVGSSAEPRDKNYENHPTSLPRPFFVVPENQLSL